MKFRSTFFLFLFSLIQITAQSVKSPEEFPGYKPGADYKIVSW